VKGATIAAFRTQNTHINFNPRTREGCDFFTSTYQLYLIDFNPRTREGCDVYMTIECVDLKISIHAPVKGATLIQKKLLRCKMISIHAPVKGATVSR